MCDERIQKTDFQVIAAGTSLLEWRDIRRIRVFFPTNALMLYRLKRNKFPLWKWASHDLSCPIQRVRLLFRPWLVTFSGIALVLGAIGSIYLDDGESLAI